LTNYRNSVIISMKGGVMYVKEVKRGKSFTF